MRRRDFLNNMAGGLALAAGSVPGLAPRLSLAADAPDVVVATGTEDGSIEARVVAAVEALGGMGRFVKAGAKVVVKPNMSFAHGVERGTNTHPEAVAAVVRLCEQAGAASVMVLDNPLRGAELCIERSGIAEACKPMPKAMVRGLTESRFYVDTDIPLGRDMKKNKVMADVLDADVVIAAPTAKSHGSTGVSLSMKGMMGLIHERGVMHWRYDLDQAIVDLNTVIPAALSIIDATRVLTSGGPHGPGDVEWRHTVIASADRVAADAAAVARFSWYGRKLGPENVGHIRLAHQQKLGRMDLENLNVAEIAV